MSKKKSSIQTSQALTRAQRPGLHPVTLTFEDSSDYGLQALDLSALDGQTTAYIRFRYHNASFAADDWAVDGIELVGWPVE